MSYTNDLREMAKKVFDRSLLIKILDNYQDYELSEYYGDWGRAAVNILSEVEDDAVVIAQCRTHYGC